MKRKRGRSTPGIGAFIWVRYDDDVAASERRLAEARREAAKDGMQGHMRIRIHLDYCESWPNSDVCLPVGSTES